MIKIPLSQGKFALIDDEDYELVSQYRWHARNPRARLATYASSNIRRPDGSWTTLQMHRLILEVPANLYVDHIDGDGLNNCKKNLRICTNAQNGRNRRKHIKCGSQYKGVSRASFSSKWRATITFNGKQTHLGLFVSEIEAAKTYDEAAKQLFGDFALLNTYDDKDEAA